MASNHCTNCGQNLTSADVRRNAEDPDVVFCCECGRKLDANGYCRNNQCKFLDEKPIQK